MNGCGDCTPCDTPALGFTPTSPGTPGGTLPDGDVGDFLQFNGTLWVPSSWTLPQQVTVNDLGEVLTVTAAGTSAMQPLFQRSMLVAIGARQISATQTWLFSWQFDSTAVLAVSQAGFWTPLISGRLRNMRVRHSTPIVSADNITYTVVLNGTTFSSMVVTLNTNTATASNLVDTLDVGASDKVNVQATGATALRALHPVVTFEFLY